MDNARLIELFRTSGALRFGDFTLASGRKSTYFMDAKLVLLRSSGLRLISEGLLELLADVEFDAVGGMSIGADPIIAGVLCAAGERGRELDGLMIRKEPKGRGTNQLVEGPFDPQARIVVVEDVVTTGGSALAACERIQQAGGQVVMVVGVVDRLEGGAENFAARDLPFRSLLTIRDFGIDPPE